mgnify:CR=1 FL=1
MPHSLGGMQIGFQIVPDLDLVYFRYARVTHSDQIWDVFDRYQSHPDFGPFQQKLVDLSRVHTAFLDMDQMLKIQEHILATRPPDDTSGHTVIYCTDDQQRQVAHSIREIWKPFTNVRIDLTDSVQSTLAHLGKSDPRITDFLTGWAPV